MAELKNPGVAGEPGKTAATGVGAVVGGVAGGVAGGAAAGAAVGGMTGPVGAVVGAAVGAVAGALAGRAVKADPDVEDAYWRENYAGRPYVEGGSYDDYSPAYRYGVDAYSRNPDRTFDEVEPDLGRDWGTARGRSSLEWERARHATRDAWQRLSDNVERAIPGDSDRDGR
ncbi:glycine zipper domain-containing protein [Variovorax sp. J22P271]|uniref:glycine zipper domain-containing protein n=1 Tax=Variovorax davisae TaxID=3053515 RepID=UPI002577C19D|nr:glycine zipper domain-containing protein [Variovorax sp. J22P271]MDM0037365.1 glycine zipper domain-containing protein [Variovorax sp. J22P271]